MTMFWIGFAACYAVSSTIFFISDEYDHPRLEAWFTAPWLCILLVVLYPPFTVYKMLRMVVRPIDPNAVREMRNRGMQDRHLFGNLYCCHDKKAQYPCNRFFFFRIANEISK